MSELNETGLRKAQIMRVFSGMFPYASAQADGISEPVTFSLNPDHGVWEEKDSPIKGTIVFLSDIRKYAKGWRAHKARYLRPEDEIKSSN